MEKTYNGACMALPERDEELFALINKTTADRRKEQEAEAARLALEAENQIYTDYGYLEEQSGVDLGRYFGAAARLLLAAVFAGGAVRGWCVPEFGLIGTAACTIAALIRWRRPGHG